MDEVEDRRYSEQAVRTGLLFGFRSLGNPEPKTQGTRVPWKHFPRSILNDPLPPPCPWTPEDDALLQKMAVEYSLDKKARFPWTKWAKANFEGRFKGIDLQERWRRHILPSMSQGGRWRPADVIKLLHAMRRRWVYERGKVASWVVVAEDLGIGRIAARCRAKWLKVRRSSARRLKCREEDVTPGRLLDLYEEKDVAERLRMIHEEEEEFPDYFIDENEEDTKD